jgi:hypothetical protein
MKAMLEPSIVAARIQGPDVLEHGIAHGCARISASSQGSRIRVDMLVPDQGGLEKGKLAAKKIVD